MRRPHPHAPGRETVMGLMPSSRIAGPLAGKLRDILGGAVTLGEPLGGHVSMGTGGPADAFCRVGSREILRKLVALLDEEGVPRLLLGGGTNILPADRGFRGAAIKLEGGLAEVSFEGPRVRAGAAAPLAGLLDGAASRGLGGLEFAAGIPGSVGGALVGNAGTSGEAVGDFVETVDVLSGGRESSRPRRDVPFSYRHSGLGEGGEIVLGASLALVPRTREESLERMKGFLAKRKEQPLALGNSGCMFKNPEGRSAGALVEQAGLKGARAGKMEVSERHANFVNNLGGGTTSEALELMALMRREVHAKFGVWLEPEVRAIDEYGRSAFPGGKA